MPREASARPAKHAHQKNPRKIKTLFLPRTYARIACEVELPRRKKSSSRTCHLLESTLSKNGMTRGLVPRSSRHTNTPTSTIKSTKYEDNILSNICTSAVRFAQARLRRVQHAQISPHSKRKGKGLLQLRQDERARHAGHRHPNDVHRHLMGRRVTRAKGGVGGV